MDRQISLNSCRKVYIERDYSTGTKVAFRTEFPTQLDGLVGVLHISISLINILILFHIWISCLYI